MSSDHYDFIIIGSGAGGGTLAWKLAPTGKKILIIERGDYVPRETDNWSTLQVNVKAKYNTKEKWYDKKGHELHPHTNYYVGGNTKFYGAALFRLREKDFGELKHHDGISPAWCVGYDEFEPYYTAAERLYQVHGTRGEDPTEPPSESPFPHPAVSHEPRIQQLHDDMVRVGHTPFHTPLGILLNEKNPRKSPCIRCSTCDGHPCLINAKSDAQTMAVDPALDYPNVTLMTRTKAHRILTTPDGRSAKSVEVERDGRRFEITGDVIVVSAGAINSAALLLRSKNDKHPSGMANGSDVIGRFYMGHVNSVVMALSKQPNPTIFQKTLSLNDFYFGDKESPLPMGHISFVGKLDAITLSAGAPIPVPGFTLDLMAKHSLDFWLTSEDLPAPENRVTLNQNGDIVLSYTPNNDEAHRLLTKRLKHLLNHLDCHDHLIPRNLFVGQRIPLGGVAHQNGTIRFGEDPTTSALNRDCRAHEIDNLYVVDASFFPSSGAVNPALTIMANALRVGDHLIDRMGLTTSLRKEESCAVTA